MEDRVSYRIPAENWEGLQARIAKITRRAAKVAAKGKLADNTPIALVQDGVETKPGPCRLCACAFEVHRGAASLCNDGATFVAGPDRVWFVAHVEGSAPHLAGWEFIATLQHEEGGTILRTVPTATITEGELTAYRNVDPSCDHCRVNRRRNDTFVVREIASKTVRQVGRNCLADFLGGLDPKTVAAWAELLAAADEACSGAESEGGGYGGGAITVGLENFLTYIACSKRTNGWTSRTKARELHEAGDYSRQASADHAWQMLFPSRDRDAQREAAEFARSIEDSDKTLVAAALAHAETLDRDVPPLSDYEHNLRVALASGYVTGRTAGIAGSVLVWYERQMGIAAERAARQAAQAQQAAQSVHFGTVKERTTYSLLCVAIHDFETEFGVICLHRFVDATGNVAVWKTSRTRLEVGTLYQIKTTVKEHGEYRGVKQTVLTRCKVIESQSGLADPFAQKAEAK